MLLGSAALIVVVAALLATNTFGLGGSTSARVTPVGWDSMGYRDAQLSFPPSFESSTPRPGGVFAVDVPISSASGGTCVGPFRDTVVCLLPLRQVASAYAGEQPAVLNGVTAYRDAKGDYYVVPTGRGHSQWPDGASDRRHVDPESDARLHFVWDAHRACRVSAESVRPCRGLLRASRVRLRAYRSLTEQAYRRRWRLHGARTESAGAHPQRTLGRRERQDLASV